MARSWRGHKSVPGRAETGFARKVRSFLVLFVVAAAGAAVTYMLPADIEGTAFVADGDSLAVEGERVRLSGIDAPELDQTCKRGAAIVRCGRLARQHLRTLVGEGPVSCKSRGFDRYGRLLAECSAHGRSLNELMVRGGWAISDRNYPLEEVQSRQDRLGLWALDFEDPQDWRRDHPRDEETARNAIAVVTAYVRHGAGVIANRLKAWFIWK